MACPGLIWRSTNALPAYGVYCSDLAHTADYQASSRNLSSHTLCHASSSVFVRSRLPGELSYALTKLLRRHQHSRSVWCHRTALEWPVDMLLHTCHGIPGADLAYGAASENKNKTAPTGELR
eukprot:3859861-Rhodomonas_salina.2